MAERSNALDCKSSAFGLRRFESCSQHCLEFGVGVKILPGALIKTAKEPGKTIGSNHVLGERKFFHKDFDLVSIMLIFDVCDSEDWTMLLYYSRVLSENAREVVN